MAELVRTADVVIIGGGVIGTSIAHSWAALLTPRVSTSQSASVGMVLNCLLPSAS
jgi:hypothetical protein